MAQAFGNEQDFPSLAALEAQVERLTSETAFARVVSQSSARERSAADVRKRLRGEGFSAAAANEAVARACELGIVSDARYAEAFVAAKLRAGWGRARIERALGENGVDPFACLEGYPDTFFAVDSETDRARELLSKRSLPAKNPVEKFARFLVGRGFDGATAFRVAREEVASRETGCDDE